jgi:hypothetical protein
MEDHADAEWLVVFSAWPQTEFHTRVPRERRIFVAGEPESFHVYQSKFLDQFGTVLTTQSKCRHDHAIQSQVGINWFAGVKFKAGNPRFTTALDFESFERGNPVKTKLCSVVCSNQAVTSGHRERIAFVNRLKEEFGDEIDFYGRGSRPMPDKDEALADYRFHIALENSRHKDYWTEKLADPILRGCFPIYSGCPNVLDYFPGEVLAMIDTAQPERSIETIRKVLRSNADSENATALELAKKKILYEYNIFAVLEEVFNKFPAYIKDANMLSRPERIYSDHEIKNQKLSRKVRRYIKSLFSEQ